MVISKHYIRFQLLVMHDKKVKTHKKEIPMELNKLFAFIQKLATYMHYHYFLYMIITGLIRHAYQNNLYDEAIYITY